MGAVGIRGWERIDEVGRGGVGKEGDGGGKAGREVEESRDAKWKSWWEGGREGQTESD
jgi:hypothetical protein